jgi:tetratricopeptide (TPR) repeat protein
LNSTVDARHSTAVPSHKEAKNRRLEPRAASRTTAPRTSAAPTRARAEHAGLLSPGVLGLIAALFAAVVYIPTLQYGWVWDDSFLVASHGAGGVGAEGFRPLASLLYRLEWAVGYGTPVFSHLMSVTLHALATWLLFTLALHLGAGAWIAFAAAAIFAAHPIHAEAVAYVSGRPDLLATVLVLASLLLARTRELCSPDGCRSWKIWFAYAALVGALLSDEVAIVTPLLLIALDRWGPEPVPFRTRRVHYAGFFAFVLVYLFVRFAAAGASAPVAGSTHDVSGIEPAARAWAPFLNFFELVAAMVVPYPLHTMRTLTAAEAASWAVRLAPFATLLVIAVFVAARRRDPLARVGAAFLLLPMIPAIPLPPFVGSFAEDRAAYLPSVGFCLLVGSLLTWGVDLLPKWRRVVAAAGIALAALAAVGTTLRLPTWRENVALLQDAAKADPTDPDPYIQLARHYEASGSLQAALGALDRALQIEPTNQLAAAHRVSVLSRLGRHQESVEAARGAIELNPKDAVSHANLSDALIQEGKPKEGVAAAARAVELDSTLVDGWYNLGVARTAEGNVPGAIEAYQHTLALAPDHVMAMNNLGALLGGQGRLEEARDLYQKLVDRAPGSLEAHMNLALVHLRLGNKEAAAQEREIVRRISPNAVQRLDAIFREYLPELRNRPKSPR